MTKTAPCHGPLCGVCQVGCQGARAGRVAAAPPAAGRQVRSPPVAGCSEPRSGPGVPRPALPPERTRCPGRTPRRPTTGRSRGSGWAAWRSARGAGHIDRHRLAARGTRGNRWQRRKAERPAVAPPITPQGQRHRRDRPPHLSPAPPTRVPAAGRWIRLGCGPPEFVQANPQVSATLGGTLGASLVTSGGHPRQSCHGVPARVRLSRVLVTHPAQARSFLLRHGQCVVLPAVSASRRPLPSDDPHQQQEGDEQRPVSTSCSTPIG